jgi:aspartate aminotransferase-like enzyme
MSFSRGAELSDAIVSDAGFLLDVPLVTASEYANIEDHCRQILGTERTTFVFQGEAIVVLEAAARGLGRPGLAALNLVHGPYGGFFGQWLSEGGAHVEDLTVPFDSAVQPELVEMALDRLGAVDVISVVHAEAATGVKNDLAAIAKIAKSRNALIVVDAVASVGAEPLPIDLWDLDLVVLAPRKALAGPSGVSMVVVGPRGWDALAANPSPWRGSILSLLDWRDLWVATDRSYFPFVPSHLETRALGASMNRVAREGIDRVIGRHRAASAATRAALAPLGLRGWARPSEAASVATLVRPPAEGSLALTAALANSRENPALITLAPPPLANDAIRVNHTGLEANLPAVLSAVKALASGMRALGYDTDLAAALEMAGETWSANEAADELSA